MKTAFGNVLRLIGAAMFTAFLSFNATAQDYCSADGGDGYPNIHAVSLLDIDNSSGDNDGYGDFSGISTEASAGDMVTIDLQPGGPWWYRYYWRVWIDYDNDGSFSNDELEVEMNGYFSESGTFQLNSDESGQVRLRIAMSTHEYEGPCGDYNTGEVEDYTLDFGDGCEAEAGTLTAVESEACFDDGASIAAIPNGDINIPEGYEFIYVLTSGTDLIIENVGGEPAFDVDEPGLYTIHTLVYDDATLDLGVVTLGETSGVDVLNLVVANGICASLDVAGAPVMVSEDVCPQPCAVFTGAQFSNGIDAVTIEDGGVYDINILPENFYLEILTDGDVGSVLIAVEGTQASDFAIENWYPYNFPGGNDPWDLGTGDFDVSASIFSHPHIEGDLCDDALFSFSLNPCLADAGTLTADANAICFDGPVTISATPNGDIVVPDNYEFIYVLTQGADLTIVNVGGEPSFEVSEPGNYTIHTLVYDDATLDLGIVTLGETTGVDVLNFVTANDICASLDVTGAPVAVNAPNAGTLSGGGEACLVDGATTLTATPNGDINVPADFEFIYVLTQGADLTIVNVGGEPSFEVNETGLFTIHTLVYDDAELDLGIVTLGETTGVDVLNAVGALGLCASLDVAGAPFNVVAPNAGTLTADADAVCFDGMNMISATPNGDIMVPDNYEFIYVLTQGVDLTIVNVGGEPSFEVSEPGNYTIHTLVYDDATLDLGIVTLGETTGVDVLNFVTANNICASLDVPGAPVAVNAPNAGTLSGGGEACLVDGAVTLTATPNGDINVPADFEFIYVLTQGAELTIVNVGGEPSFEVNETGLFTIHTLVYDDAELDLGIVELGVTTGVDVLNAVAAFGLCASLDVAGAPFNVVSPDAGTLTADANAVCFDGPVTISGTPNGDIMVPENYEVVYVLTQGAGLTIVNAGPAPSFEVSEPGNYTIHTLVYDDATLDLGIVELGVTTGVDVLNYVGANNICASLDVPGAPVAVNAPNAGTLSGGGEACLVDGAVTLTATPNGDINVPADFEFIYVLTQGAELTIVNVGGEPSFEVNETGLFTIHTLVYDDAELDLGIVELGVTTGVDVLNAVAAFGLCASLDVAGAPFNVQECACAANAGTTSPDMESPLCFYNGLTLNATPNGDQNVPEGYSTVYVLTTTDDLVIIGAGPEPSFEVSTGGTYRIHTLVYDESTLDLGIVVPGVTTGVDVLNVLVENGICASLDVPGALFTVEQPAAGSIHPEDLINCYYGENVDLVGLPQDNAIVPDGYEVLYVLTEGFSLTILDVNSVPEFSVDGTGLYRIHTLVYNPETLDLSIVEIGSTTGFDVFFLISAGGGDICASLDVGGAPFLVLNPYICELLQQIFRGDMASNVDNLESKWLNDVNTMQDLERKVAAELWQVSLFPNPTEGELNLSVAGLTDATDFNVEIRDVTGRIVGSYQLNDMDGNQRAIDVSAMQNGRYSLTLWNTSMRKTLSFIVLK